MAKVDDIVIPTSNVHFLEGKDGGWREDALLTREVPPELAIAAMAAMKGKRVALFLQIVNDGKKVPLTLTFEVTDVRPGS